MAKKRPVEQYEHRDKKRVNNPPAGLVDRASDQDSGKQTYAYDPHLDPQLQWAGKAERTSFDVPTVSLHVHERIDPRGIIEAVRKKNGSNYEQLSLFNAADENPPLREAIDFYKHKHNWSNRLIAGDSLLVMNSLLEKEGMAGSVQMIYFDPPYGIKYGSNFQPFVNKRDVKDGKDDDLTTEPEMIKAFRDTWELGIHSYLTYLRDRLLLAKELLHESGSIFVQISDENVHHVREIMDEVFGVSNFVSIITFAKTTGFSTNSLASISDYFVWYARDIQKLKYRQLFKNKEVGDEGATKYKPIGSYSSVPKGHFIETRLATLDQLTSQGASQKNEAFEYQGKIWKPPVGMHWKTSVEGMQRLADKNRLVVEGNSLRFIRLLDDYPVFPINNLWNDIGGIQNREEGKLYVVQTATLAVRRCLLMTTDPGDVVLDITCGSGTTAMVAEQWGMRWITCDTSRVATTLAKQRLMTAVFDYYELAQQHEGISSGFKYRTVPHITLKELAHNEPSGQETLYDQPITDNGKVRVTGPFTVEAVPAPTVTAPGEVETPPGIADQSIARSGETLRQEEWRAELLRSGIRAKNGQYITFSRVEPLSGTRWLQADAETKLNDKGGKSVKEDSPGFRPERAVISFGPVHAPLEQKQVEAAIEEARTLVPKPKIIVFAAFQFDPEAAKDIDETNWPGVTLLKAQMNADLLTDDLKKKRTSNDSFWLIGQPDVRVKKVKSDLKGQGRLDVPAGQEPLTATFYRVEVHGFDYYNTKTGEIESGNSDRIAMWMLDTDYDGRSLFPRQVFFPMAGEKEGWARLAKNLKAEIDEEQIEKYRGSISLPFAAGEHARIAVKIVDDRGIESLKVVDL